MRSLHSTARVRSSVCVPQLRSRSWLKRLLVVPLSVLSNWDKQIQDHCVPNTLSHAIYYGATRDMSAAELQKYDVVVTTYQTAVGEHNGSEEAAGKRRKKQTSSLFGIPWKVRFCLYRSSATTRVDANMALACHSGRGPQYQEPSDEDGPIRVCAQRPATLGFIRNTNSELYCVFELI